ncbi:3-oxoacyl-[acyl-carrier-protein] reductase FabG-like [Mytilus galloprovincialis]|uniref:3-oxoacyl-[acyl-carrier-protein] reductase FabG-like n=1 Tax=Mytilus galloprovincialis TaxID=29158 RepID=UPI003F7BB834
MASLQDKVTIITGASSGIGESTALLFAESKAKVVLAARNVENLEKVASLCKTKGLSDSDVLVIQCDVTSEDNLKTLVDETVKKFGRIDVLINNAGKGTPGNVMVTPEATLDDIMNVNFKSIYNLSRLCVPHLIKTQGSIVNVSSIGGQRAGPDLSAYCISKAALDMFTRLLALELAPQKVRVNSVNPGYILTPFFENAKWPSAMTTDYLERLKVLQPLGGAGKPEDVAKAIRFLASDEASFTTGHLLYVDSGRHCGLPV